MGAVGLFNLGFPIFLDPKRMQNYSLLKVLGHYFTYFWGFGYKVEFFRVKTLGCSAAVVTLQASSRTLSPRKSNHLGTRKRRKHKPFYRQIPTFLGFIMTGRISLSYILLTCVFGALTICSSPNPRNLNLKSGLSWYR